MKLPSRTCDLVQITQVLGRTCGFGSGRGEWRYDVRGNCLVCELCSKEPRRMRWAAHAARKERCKMRTNLPSENMKASGHLRFMGEDNIKMNPVRSACLVHPIHLYALRINQYYLAETTNSETPH
jgi:hypothetical protein